MSELDIAGNYQIMNTVANGLLKQLGPAFTDTPRGHTETDIAASCSLSGLMILQETVLDLTQHDAGNVILAKVHGGQEQVLHFMRNVALSMGLDPISGWDTPVPKGHEPMFECQEMTRRLALPFYEECDCVDLERTYYKFAAALAGMKLVAAGRNAGILDPEIGKGLAFYYVVAGSKTVPHWEALWQS